MTDYISQSPSGYISLDLSTDNPTKEKEQEKEQENMAFQVHLQKNY